MRSYRVRPVFALVAVGFACGCAEWVPIRSAREVGEGQLVKVERPGRTSTFDEIIVCDKSGFVFAKQWIDCREGAPFTYDTRRDKVFVYEKHTGVVVGVVVLGVLTVLFVTVYAVAGAIIGNFP